MHLFTLCTRSGNYWATVSGIGYKTIKSDDYTFSESKTTTEQVSVMQQAHTYVRILEETESNKNSKDA